MDCFTVEEICATRLKRCGLTMFGYLFWSVSYTKAFTIRARAKGIDLEEITLIFTTLKGAYSFSGLCHQPISTDKKYDSIGVLYLKYHPRVLLHGCSCFITRATGAIIIMMTHLQVRFQNAISALQTDFNLTWATGANPIVLTHLRVRSSMWYQNQKTILI